MKTCKYITAALLLTASTLCLAAKPGTEPPPPDQGAILRVWFTDIDPANCNFAVAGSTGAFRQNYVYPDQDYIIEPNGSVMASRPTVKERDRYLLELMIEFGGLSLTPEDFIDATTGEFDCTTDKLLSLI